MSLSISRGIRYMVVGSFFFSMMTLLVKVAGQGIPTAEIVLSRAVVTLALSWFFVRRQGIPIWGYSKGFLILRGVLGFIALFLFYFAVTRLPLADVTVLHYMHPVFTALIAALALGERMSGKEVALVLTSLVGVLMVAKPSFLFGRASGLDPIAVAAALIAAVVSAGAYVTVRRLGRTEEATVIVFYFSLVSTLGAIPAAAPVWVTPVGWEWLVLLGVGVATQGGQVFMTWALRWERAGRAMAVGYLQIVLAALWGFLFFDEVPDGWTGVGALVIVLCTFLIGRGRTPSSNDDARLEVSGAGPERL